MPTATPTAASTPAAETLNVGRAPFDLAVLVEEELPEPVLEPETVPVEEAGPLEGVLDAGGYCEPWALISNDEEVVKTFVLFKVSANETV